MVGVYFLLRTISLLYGKLIVKYFDIELQICFVNMCQYRGTAYEELNRPLRPHTLSAHIVGCW